MTNEQLPVWKNGGIEPPDNLKQNGFSPEYKPTAQHMNWLFNRTYETLENTQETIGSVTEQLAQIAINVKEFGAAGDGVTDDTAALQLAFNTVPAGSTLLLMDKHKITTGLTCTKAIKIKGNSSKILSYLTTGAALTIGKSDAYISANNASGVYPMLEDFTVEHMIGSATENEVNVDGIVLLNVIQAIWDNILISNFRRGKVLKAINNKGTSQNTFYNTRIIGNLIGIETEISNSGWITENAWYKGQITTTSDTSVHNDKSIMVNLISHSQFLPDHNIFNDINFENRWSDKIVYCDGAYNVFNNCRWESTKNGSVIFTANSYSNSVVLGFGNGGIAISRFNDISKRNTFISSSGSSKFYGASSFGLVTGTNDTQAENGGRAEYPVFYTMHKATPSTLSMSMGPMGLHSFRSTRQDYPSIKIDSVNGRLYITNGYYAPESCAYFQSTNTSIVELMHDSLNPVLRVGSETNKGMISLSNYFIWVDSNGKLRINYGTKPTNLDTQGTVINPKMANQTSSSATDVTTLKNDFNALLNKLKSAGYMEA